MLLGKLHMSEWAIGGTTQNVHFGVGHNAWDHDRVPGGSSGGSGAAAAADLALVTIGTDTGGSIRLPGALNGVIGLRPTHGRVSNRGSIPVAWSFDTIGPLCRRAEDAALVLGAIAGYDPGDPVSVERAGRRLHGRPHRRREGPEAGRARRRLPRSTAAPRGRRPPGRREGRAAWARDDDRRGAASTAIERAVELTAELLLSEAAAFHAERLAESPSGFAQDVQTRLRRGQAVTGTGYAAGRQEQRIWRRGAVELLEGATCCCRRPARSRPR